MINWSLFKSLLSKLLKTKLSDSLGHCLQYSLLFLFRGYTLQKHIRETKGTLLNLNLLHFLRCSFIHIGPEIFHSLPPTHTQFRTQWLCSVLQRWVTTIPLQATFSELILYSYLFWNKSQHNNTSTAKSQHINAESHRLGFHSNPHMTLWLALVCRLSTPLKRKEGHLYNIISFVDLSLLAHGAVHRIKAGPMIVCFSFEQNLANA